MNPTDSQAHGRQEGRRRPPFVTWLTVGVLTLAAVYLTRLGASLSAPVLPLTVPPIYLSLTGGLWGGVGLVAAFGLWTGRPWAPAWTRWTAVALAVWFWADRLLWAQSEFARLTRPLAAAMTALILAVVWWGLARPGIRHFFQETQA
ncbi:MAG: hypothetical protein ACRDG5_11870 [Anaerolineales bacterium]